MSRQITKLVITIASIVFLTAGLIHLVRARAIFQSNTHTHTLTPGDGALQVENEWDVTRSDPVVTFGDSLYFIVVTISTGEAQARHKSQATAKHTAENKQTITHTLPTVGYGDISPDGTEGKIVVAVMIVVVIVFVPMQVGELTNLLAARSPFTARVSAGATPHALLIGNLSNVNVVRVGAPPRRKRNPLEL